jgi:hypothetical protein
MIVRDIKGRGRFARGVISAAIVALGITVGAQRAMAQFTLTSEDREIDANVSFGDDDDVSTPGVYNNTVSDVGNPSDMTGDSISTTAMGSQDTDIEVTGFSGTGSAITSAEVSGLIQDSTAAEADSSFTVVFTVPVPTGIQLSGELDSDVNGTESVLFDSFIANGSEAMPAQPFSFSEILEPGTIYTLSISSSSDSGASVDGDVDLGFEDSLDSGSGTYTFTFDEVSVPEPASLGLLAMAAPALLVRRRRGRLA